MNREDEERQIRETRSLLQKAGQRNAPQDAKRDALRRLINLTHTPSRELKIFAAQHLSLYFKEFPELEKEVIDSVYDICEDPDSQVRIEGYKGIVSLSSESRRWTRRNTDVLVQLLQSDEPVELKQIQDSLIAHVKLDPPAAIGVLCDHCSLEADLTADEKEDREKLRKLVLMFLSNGAKEAVFSHLGGPGSEAEDVFRNGLMKAIPGADLHETEIIVKDLLLPLSSYTTRSKCGNELQELLLDKVKTSYTNIKSKPGSISLASVQPYLSLLEYVTVIKKVANPGPLLRFYSMTLIDKMALQKLDQPSQISVVERLADILAVSEETRLREPQAAASQELLTLRDMVVEASPHLFVSLIKAQNHERKKWQTSMTLLRACRQSQIDQKWTPPTSLNPILYLLGTLAERVPANVKDVSEEVRTLIKALNIEPSKIASPLTPEHPVPLKRKLEVEPPPAPPSQCLPSSNGKPSINDPRLMAQSKSQPSGKLPAEESGPRASKLINRLGGDVSVGERSFSVGDKAAPMLLRRMLSADTKNGVVGGNGPSNSNGRSSSEVDTNRPASVPPVVPKGLGSSSGLSIKGAASRDKEAKQVKPISSSPALIERMQLDDDGQKGNGEQRQGGRRRKRNK